MERGKRENLIIARAEVGYFRRTSKRRGIGTIGTALIVLCCLIVALFPTSHDGLVEEYYKEKELVHRIDLKKTIKCDIKIADNRIKSWSFTNLGETLRVVIDISSTEEIRLKIESKNGIEIENKNKILHYNKTINGPSLVISLYNPLELFGRKADLTGSIKIYHEYDKIIEVRKSRIVPGKVWNIWWMSRITL